MTASSPNEHTIGQLGEEKLIARFFKGQSVYHSSVVEGMGDDCAVRKLNQANYELISTDQLVEDVHFSRSLSSPFDIGHKAAAVNLSDIAAMGGKPTGILLSLGLPVDTSIHWVEGFSKGFLQLCRSFEVPLLGGDTTASKQGILIGVTVIGEVEKANLKLRRNAQPADLVCVTATLGDSAAGLHCLKVGDESKAREEVSEYLKRKHRRPDPALRQGRWLGRQESVHAMIDLSDGVATDALHVAKASKVQINIQTKTLPLSAPFKEYLSNDEQKKLEFALAGGEDYQLLFTADPNDIDDLFRKYEEEFNTRLYNIGEVENGQPRITYFTNGKETEPPKAIFNHFKQK